MEKDICSKENLEGFVNDFLHYLYETYSNDTEFEGERLSENVYVYVYVGSLKKRYYVNDINYTYKFKDTPILVEDNIKVEDKDVLKYYNKEILTFIMEGCSLQNYLWYWCHDIPDGKIVLEKIDEIFSKHGLYRDFGNDYIGFAFT